MLALLQKIGRSLMLPVAALPAAAIMQRFGKIDYAQDFHFGTFGKYLNHYVAPFMEAGGSAIFDNLPLIFAVGISIGIVGDAVATLAAVMAYLVLTNVLIEVPKVFQMAPGAEELNMGVMGGILAGLTASYCYKKYHRIKLPDWLGFFGGKRFVPIVTSFLMIVIGLPIGLIWGPVQTAMNDFGRWVVELNGIGAFIFGTANRLLIPFGLHHVLNNIAWFQIGEFADEAGRKIHGDLYRFFAGDKDAGLFMTGFFPIMMFALPAAALAIIHTAQPQKRKVVSSIFLGAALTSFLTGITEPLEVAFMFVAPLLYVVHAVLTGLSGLIAAEFGVKYGFGFSAGFIDYALNLPQATKPLLIIPLGLGFSVVYYFLFRTMIVKFNLKTPGREDDSLTGPQPSVPASASAPVPEAARLPADGDPADSVLAALGGKTNIQSIDACITRLRLVVKDEQAVDDEALKRSGALGVIRLGKGSVQAVFGTQAEKLKDEIKSRM
ncbi:PTS transporter subunit EIIC [Paenibacillus sp. GCM10027626]|uniref:PTS transporter subunit EIIC n=1 Tax=Paenibacillus sp. GCM10027626 TaxID=3273411 RepID=UPI00363102BC